jgi:hypothetical protein
LSCRLFRLPFFLLLSSLPPICLLSCLPSICLLSCFLSFRLLSRSCPSVCLFVFLSVLPYHTFLLPCCRSAAWLPRSSCLTGWLSLGCLSTCLSVCLSVCLSRWLPLPLAVCRSVWLAICLSVCL